MLGGKPQDPTLPYLTLPHSTLPYRTLLYPEVVAAQKERLPKALRRQTTPSDCRVHRTLR